MSYIPKIIHYCWFGGNPLPPSALDCISSWKKYFPDYEIKEWNETNFDVNAVPFSRDAYALKKYAFVSDYARFQILYESGGIYFDTDVEVIKSFDDIIANGSYMGFENGGVNPGLGFAVTPRHPLIKEMLDVYASLPSFREDGTFNQTTVVAHTTQVLEKHGLLKTNTIQERAGVTIYPMDYFCPLNYETNELTITANTRSIHHYSATWVTFNLKMFKKIEHCCGRKLAKFMSRMLRAFHLLK